MARHGADGYELIVGSSLDPQFGPVLLFGTGGQLVEVFKDRALALPPLNTTLARRMMEQTRIYKALKGVRGRPPVDLAGAGATARPVQPARGRAALGPRDRHQPAPRLARPRRPARARRPGDRPRPGDDRPSRCRGWPIRPYPVAVRRPLDRRKTGRDVLIRPIRPEDEPLMARFHETLSDRSVSFRFFHAMKLSARVAHERLTRICFIDYDREMALVAEARNILPGRHEVLAVGRLSKLRGRNEAEFGLLSPTASRARGSAPSCSAA